MENQKSLSESGNVWRLDKWEVSGMGPNVERVATVRQSKPLDPAVNQSLIQLIIFLIEEGGGSTGSSYLTVEL